MLPIISKQTLRTLIKNKYLQDLVFLYITLALVLGSYISSPGIITVYKCYSEAFLLRKIPLSDKTMCKKFAVDMSHTHKYQLPPEYPILTLIPFSLPLLFEKEYFNLFRFEMFVVTLFLFVYLQKTQSKRVSFLFLFYLLLGGFGTAFGRFDLLPTCLIFLSLQFAYAKRFSFAYSLLAIATLLKLFPILFVIPLLLYESSVRKLSLKDFYRSKGLLLYVFICTLVTSISLLFNVKETINPIGFFLSRPNEIESLPASVLWIFTFSHVSLFHIAAGFGSINLYPTVSRANIFNPIFVTHIVSLCFFTIFILGLLLIYYCSFLKKISLEKSYLSIILLIFLTGKVFSPQYVIWIVPFAAYVFHNNLSWIKRWGIFFFLTTLIYPFSWTNSRFLFIPILARNIMLIAISFLYYKDTISNKVYRNHEQ